MSSDVHVQQDISDKADRRFRIFFRTFLSLGILLCSVLVFDDTSSMVARVITGLFAVAGVFMFVAIGKPTSSRLYACAIGLFCLIFGGVGVVTCLFDKTCVPTPIGLWMVLLTMTFVAGAWVFMLYPRHRVALFWSRLVGLTSFVAMLCFAYFHPAMGGALMFLAFAGVAFAAVAEGAAAKRRG